LYGRRRMVPAMATAIFDPALERLNRSAERAIRRIE
jgi:hypothetical protein